MTLPVDHPLNSEEEGRWILGFPSGFVSVRDGANPANRSAGKNSPAVEGRSVSRTPEAQRVFASAIEWKRFLFSRVVRKASGSTTKGGASTEEFPRVTCATPAGGSKVMGSPVFDPRSSG